MYRMETESQVTLNGIPWVTTFWNEYNAIPPTVELQGIPYYSSSIDCFFVKCKGVKPLIVNTISKHFNALFIKEFIPLYVWTFQIIDFYDLFFGHIGTFSDYWMRHIGLFELYFHLGYNSYDKLDVVGSLRER